jgi:hypothetical protein
MPVGPKAFDLISYKKPKAESRQKEIRWFVGIDTEAYRNGGMFMCCSSEGDTWTPKDVPECFFDPKFTDAHFALFNMKYDSGALLRTILPNEKIKILARYGEVEYDDYKIKYLPHKHLAITKDEITKEFWDVAQYYHSSLDRAAETYLGKNKIKIETKSFSRRYVKKNWKKLSKYCIRDARLTADLAEYFKRKLNEFGIKVCSLYSPASLSFRYFTERMGRIVDVFSFWETAPDLLRFAHEAYQGGKFEITQRGSFSGYEYDIVSAYPYEMQNLVDIENCAYLRSKKYHPDAVYAFIRCLVTHNRPDVPPCHGILLNGVRVYCMGTNYMTLTLNEYKYLTENNIDVKIIDAYWLFPDETRFPYRDTIEYLFSIKDKYRSDKMLYSIAKLMMNSYYGRMANLNERHEPTDDIDLADKHGEITTYDAGSAWNPVYAAMITANTRLAVCRLQQRLGPSCIGTHTDSVITLDPLPDDLISSDLGGVKLELSGPGLIIGTGLYDMAGHTAYRGFEMPHGFTWRKLMEQHPGARKFMYKQLRVISWTQATAWDRLNETNVFQHVPKYMDINADVKRSWPRPVRGKDLLTGLQSSDPRVHTDMKKPWKD